MHRLATLVRDSVSPRTGNAAVKQAALKKGEHLRDSRRALRSAVQGLSRGSAGSTRVGSPMGADPACLKGSGACIGATQVNQTARKVSQGMQL